MTRTHSPDRIVTTTIYINAEYPESGFLRYIFNTVLKKICVAM
jgi:hypothetical protein